MESDGDAERESSVDGDDSEGIDVGAQVVDMALEEDKDEDIVDADSDSDSDGDEEVYEDEEPDAEKANDRSVT